MMTGAPHMRGTLSMNPSLLIIPILGFLVYLPGLPGTFLFDDYPNILDNDALTSSTLNWNSLISASFSGDAGPLKRPLSMLTFALNYAFGGASPIYFKLTNIAIHIIDAMLVFFVSRRLIIQLQNNSNEIKGDLPHIVAFSVALLWMVHPINLTSVLYVVQRMTSLATFFVLVGILIFLMARVRMLNNPKGFVSMLVGTLVAGLLAVFSKENGILLFGYLFVIEVTLFQFKTNGKQSKFWLKLYFSTFVIIPTVCVCGYFLFNSGWLIQLYEFRSFTLFERLLTEARALCFYVKMLFLPNISSFALFHDDFDVSTGLFSPFSTVFSVAAIGAALIGGIVSFRTHKLLGFAIFWFLWGHILESTLWPLELIHEHRNYMPSIGPLFCVVYALAQWVHAKNLHPALRYSPLILIILFAPITALRAADWKDLIGLTSMEAAHHPNSPRTQYELGRAYITLFVRTKQSRYLAQAQKHLEISSKLNDSDPIPLFALIHIAFMDHQQPSTETLKILSERLRKERVRPTTLTAFQKLVVCTAKGLCTLPPNDVLNLFGNMLKNPALKRGDKAKTLTQLASYYTNILRDHQAAITILDEVAGMFPADSAYRRNLIEMLLVTGETEQATQEIKVGRKQLTTGGWRQNRKYWEAQFLRLENQLKSTQNQQPFVDSAL